MESNGINKGIVAIIILLIIAILSFNAYVLYERYLYDHKNTDNNINNINSVSESSETGTVSNNIKENENLDYIYDADYNSEISSDTYTIGDKEYNINDYKVPYININSSYVKTANEEIKKIWEDMLEIFNKGLNDGTSYVDRLSYKSTVKDDILSLYVEYSIGGDNAFFTEYKSYNINLKDGSEYTLVDAIKVLDYDLTTFRTKASENVSLEYDKWYEENDSNGTLKSQYYDEYKEKTLNELKIDEWFLDSDNNINIITQIYVPNNENYYNAIITVEK